MENTLTAIIGLTLIGTGVGLLSMQTKRYQEKKDAETLIGYLTHLERVEEVHRIRPTPTFPRPAFFTYDNTAPLCRECDDAEGKPVFAQLVGSRYFEVDVTRARNSDEAPGLLVRDDILQQMRKWNAHVFMIPTSPEYVKADHIVRFELVAYTQVQRK